METVAIEGFIPLQIGGGIISMAFSPKNSFTKDDFNSRKITKFAPKSASQVHGCVA